MTYALTLLGGLVAGAFMLPVVRIMFPAPTDMDLQRVMVRDTPVVVEPAVNDYEGSVAQAVVRATGRARSAIYRGVAHVSRHARRVTWERPCNLVRKHRAGRKGGYHNTISSGRLDMFADVARQRDWIDDRQEQYEGRHSAEHASLAADLEAMLQRHDFSMREINA